MNILKIGDQYINMDNVTTVSASTGGHAVYVGFVGRSDPIVLSGDDAKRIIKYMQSVTTFIEFAEDL